MIQSAARVKISIELPSIGSFCMFTYLFVTIACKNPENFQWTEMVSTNATNDTSVLFDDDVMAMDETDLQSGFFIISTIYGIDSVKRCQDLCIKSLACT